VKATPDNNEWTIDASHETLEMLVDPAGSRLQTSRAIEVAGNTVRDSTGQFEYVVEACDPCEADDFAYSIDGIAVSDFITPHFYDPVATAGTRYSFGGNITRPREILKGGYISFINQQSDQIEQILFLDDAPELRVLGSAANGLTLREFIDSETSAKVAEKRKPNEKLSKWCKEHRQYIHGASLKRAGLYEPKAAHAAR